MKKKILKLTVSLIISIGVYNVYCIKQAENNSQMSTLMIANIEALASGETAKCTDSCKEWSGNSGGGIACDCGRYTGKCKNRC